MRSLWAIVAATLCLVACTPPGTRVVLLPQEDGRSSSVVVSANGGQKLLDKPFQRAKANASATGAPEVDQVDPAKTLADNKPLFDLAPARAQRYIVYFDDGVMLTSDSQRTMTQALAAAESRPGSDIVITGHTDTVGATAQNDALSAMRAQQVRKMFIERRFPPSRIEAVGRGERELAVPTADETTEPRNRRVTIEVR
jgi:OmpA-OmpF porin, OOP family